MIYKSSAGEGRSRKITSMVAVTCPLALDSMGLA